MILKNIKSAVDKGVIIHWKSDNYIVKKDKKLNEYNVISLQNNNIVGLTYKNDNNKCTHDLKDFYICPLDCDYFNNYETTI